MKGKVLVGLVGLAGLVLFVVPLRGNDSTPGAVLPGAGLVAHAILARRG